MENRKGNEIFLGVVGVATLLVAIVGATFAYFSATTNSDEGAVQAAAVLDVLVVKLHLIQIHAAFFLTHGVGLVGEGPVVDGVGVQVACRIIEGAVETLFLVLRTVGKL